MRAVPITVSALAAAFLLTACGGGDDSSSANEESKAASGSACAAGDLGLEVGPVSAAPAAGDTGTVTVTITNNGAECTLEGFPKVELEADGTTAAVPEDEAGEPQKLTLAKQATASFTITYARAEEGGSKSLAVKTAKYSLPGGSADESFAWSYGDVALKGEDTPDASVSAVQQAGD